MLKITMDVRRSRLLFQSSSEVGFYFGPEARKYAFKNFFCKPRPARVSLESPRLENISQIPGNQAEVRQNYHARKAVPATLSVLKWGPMSAQKLENERSKTFAVSILLETKAIRSSFRDPRTGKYPPSSRKFSRSLSKSPCA